MTSKLKESDWWLKENYAPVQGEMVSEKFEVEGTIPSSLNGLYVRNGPNPEAKPSKHWFDAIGMVHGVRLDKGQASWYRASYVHTPLLDPEYKRNKFPIPLTDTTSGVSLIDHGNKLLSLGEFGFPYELSKEDLHTIGAYDYEGRLKTSMTAHPKIDPRTGELHFFGYGIQKPYLTYHLADKSGELVFSREIEIPASVMMHDMALSTKYVIFMDLPILFDMRVAMQGKFPFKWSDKHKSRLGLLSRDDLKGEVRWFEINPCYIFHVLNAFDSEEKVILDVARYPELWKGDNTRFKYGANHYRYTIDLKSGHVDESQIDDRTIEFPQLNWQYVGVENKHSYAVETIISDEGTGLSRSGNIVFHDRQNGSTESITLPDNLNPDEPFFVADRGAGGGENEGWLIMYAYNPGTDKSELVILNANSPSAKPQARIKLPRRVPFGYHGTWSCMSDL